MIIACIFVALSHILFSTGELGMDHVAEVDKHGPSVADREGRLRALELLLSRQSVGVLEEPAPEGAELDLILDAGLRAPDHGRLRPWRFVLIRGDERLAWGERLAEAAQARDPATAQMLGDRYRAWVRRTPLLIAIGAEIHAGHKIPEIEQLLSAGARR
jgi:nitroreductase